MRRRLQLIAFSVVLATGASARAGDSFPLRRIRQLSEPNLPPERQRPKPTPVARVTTARVVVANYRLIRKDFPATRRLNDAAIDRWLLRHVGYLAVSQIEGGASDRRPAEEAVSGPIATEGEAVLAKAYRPGSYGRGLVFKVPGGLIDGKGYGAENPQHGAHYHGLAQTAEALHEFAYIDAVGQILEHADVQLGVVGSYGVIDWGFDIRYPDGRRAPAGVLLRQAHNRLMSPHLTNNPVRGGLYNSSLLEDDVVGLRIERILRRYGVTSAGGNREKRDFDKPNIQMARNGTGAGELARVALPGKRRNLDTLPRLVDLAAFRSFDRFPARRVAMWQRGATLIAADAPDYPQPDPDLSLPTDDWAVVETFFHTDAIGRTAQELATGFRDGTVSRHDIEQRLAGLHDRIAHKLGRATAAGGTTRVRAWRTSPRIGKRPPRRTATRAGSRRPAPARRMVSRRSPRR